MKYWKSHRAHLAKGRSKTKATVRRRSLSFEPLESRQLLSVNLSSTEKVYFSPIPPVEKGALAAETPSGAHIVPLADTFKLHSNPTATKVIYLDFNGHVTSGTAWRDGATLVTPAFSRDSDPNFSDAELEIIQNIWARVSEDFAPFNVNVTTEEPTLEDLRKFGAGDVRWGQRVAIGGSSDDWAGGGIGGVAFGSFNWDSDTPCFAFSLSVGNSEKNIAEVISHEVGHTLGLGHDGAFPGTEYYGGHGSGPTGWAPIMGVGYGQQLTQWSKGEYPNANRPNQDDLTVITTRNGFGYRADDHGNTIASATPLTVNGTQVSNSGIIERNTDADYFSFSHQGGAFILRIDPFFRGPNLDILATIYDSQGNVVATSNPVNSLEASFIQSLPEGVYYLAIRGTGKPASGSDAGYSNYASLGQYTISGTLAAGDIFPPTVVNLDAPDIKFETALFYVFYVTYEDNEAVNVGSLDSNDIVVMGPNGFQQTATFLSVDPPDNGTPRVATYYIFAPDGLWDYLDNGVYTIIVQANQVSDLGGNFMDETTIGTFVIDIFPRPTAPINLVATAASTTRIELRWTDTADNEDSYYVERKTGLGGTWTTIAVLGADANSYRDAGLASGVTFYYRVRALNISGYSPYSNEDDAKTKSAPPSTPKKLTATKGDFTDKVRVSWSSVPDAIRFEVWRSTTKDSSDAKRVAIVTGQRFDDVDVSARVRYWYWVKARNGDGIRSEFSNVDSGYVSKASKNLSSGPVQYFSFDRNYIAKRFGELYGPLSASQRAGLNQLLSYMERDKDITDIRWVAYMLATAQHDTEGTWLPIEEKGRGAGKPYGKRDPVTGQIYYGRGYIQLKEKANYQKVGKALGIDLVRNPELANNPEIAYRIMSYTMRTGILSGHKLSDHITGSKTDYQKSRWIVNGNDHASRIATYASRWENMLNRSLNS